MSGTEPRIPIDIGPLLGESGGSLRDDGTIEIHSIDVGDDSFLTLAPVRYEIRVDAVGGMLVLVGTAEVQVRTRCSRCLVEFDLALASDIDVCIVDPGDEEGLPEEQERVVRDGELLDAWPSILAALVGAAPFAPIHRDDCAGLCQSCGADLNDGPCGCVPDRSDSPFAALEGLFPDDEGGSDT